MRKDLLLSDKDPIQMLRGFLALAIIWHHLGPSPLQAFGYDITFMFWMPGRVIIWLFFVISGYSIYYGYRNQKYTLTLQDSLRFYFNRMIRILPLFYLSVVLTWVYFLSVSPQDVPAWQKMLRTMLFLEINFYQGIFAFTPTWFIGILVHFYLLAPILVLGYRKIRGKFGLIATFCTLIILSAFCHSLGKAIANTTDIRNFMGSAPLFLFGFFAYDVYADDYRLKDTLNKIATSRILFVVLACIFEGIFFVYHRRSVDFWSSSFLEGFVGLLGVALIVALLHRKAEDTRNENILCKGIKAFMGKAGKFSYGLYLWHSLIFMLIVSAGLIVKAPPYETATFLSVFLLIALLSFCVSFIFYSLIEKPYHNLYKTG